MPKKQSNSLETLPKLSARTFPTREQMNTIISETGIGFWIEKALIYKAGIDVRDMIANRWIGSERFRQLPTVQTHFYLVLSKALTRGGYPYEQVPLYYRARAF